MNPARPCSGMSRDASRSGAGQPPVRSASWCPSVGVSPAIPMPSKKRATSVASKRSASARTSTRSPPARNRATPEGRVRPGGDHQLDPLRAVSHELREQRADLGRLGTVVVVEHERDTGSTVGTVAAVGQRVEQPWQRDVADAARPCPHRIDRRRGDAGLDTGQRRRHVRPEPLRLDVPGVERHPGEPAEEVGLRPLRQQRGLAEPGRCADQGQRPAPSRAQGVQQPRAAHGAVRQARRHQLGPDHAPLRPRPEPTCLFRADVVRHATLPRAA